MSATIQTTRLEEILSDGFHIDVSRNEPFLVQTDGSAEVRLSPMSVRDYSLLQREARNQYVRSVLMGDEQIEERRAALYFISEFMAHPSRQMRGATVQAMDRLASCEASTRRRRSGEPVVGAALEHSAAGDPRSRTILPSHKAPATM